MVDLLKKRKNRRIINRMDTKKEAERMMSFKGEVRGMTLKTDERFVLKRFGKEGVEKVEKRMEDLGYTLKYKDVSSMDYYPLGMRMLSLVAIKEALGLSDERIREMGRAAPRASLLIRFFMKYFLSPQKTFERANEIWEKHYTVGSVDVAEVAEDRVVLQISGMESHPVFCNYLIGYLSSLGRIIVQKEVELEETKCVFKGDNLHEFVCKWQMTRK